MIQQIWELGRILRTQKLAPSRRRALREKKLKKVLRYSYEHVPYYRSLFDSAGISPDEIRTVHDLTKVPVTTKDDLRAAGTERVTSNEVDVSKCIVRRTSGSSGKPLAIYRTRSELRTRSNLTMAALIAIGYWPTDRLLVLGPESHEEKKPHHRLGLFQREVLTLSMPLDEQIRLMNEFQPTVIWAYPSAVRAFMHNWGKPLKELVNPRIFITSAEACDRRLRHRIQEELDAEIFNFYAAEEFGLIAWECTAHEGLHLNSDHFILEFIEEEEPSPSGGGRAAVLTSLYARAMPFIRYRLGDLCALTQRECSCGSPLPLIDYPIGRENDALSLPSGRMLSPIQINWILDDFTAIDQWRLVQESSEHFVLQLVMRYECKNAVFQSMHTQLLNLFSEPVRLDIQLVGHMEDEADKFKTFFSKVTSPDALSN